MELRIPRTEGRVFVKSTLAWYWKLDNFAVYGQEVGHYLSSPPFKIGDHDEFRLLLYPRGMSNVYKDHVNICLQRLSPVTIEDTNNTEYQISISHKNLKKAPASRCKYPAVPASLSELPKLSLGRQLLLNIIATTEGRLTIKCEVFESDLTRMGPPKPRGILGLGTFLNNEKYSDVKIVVGNQTIYAHKLILTNGNDVFAAMFEHSMIENEKSLIEIDDITHEVMLEVLRYIYSGEVVEIDRIAKDLLIAADKYGIRGLKTMCEQHLMRCININNVLEYFCFADSYNADILRESSKNFVKVRRKEILGTPSLENLVESMPPRLVVEIMRTFA
ncbi:hypothetical protein QAD02_019066 [Eretmocerus hayati]|uniref:Uncharacterized protein n=1 Tax=Eretmocerus hayati TaxID=131215 RepID=A0ACC2PI51_9HYME|nr:hypothetical protein QAD02_019066 [Eretmocerus hayati]